MLLIRCPWPPTELRPNFRNANHWSKWRPKVKPYKSAVWKLCLEQSVHSLSWPSNQRVELSYTFHAPDGCRWDRDARESAFKWGQDAIAETMRVDDKFFHVAKSHGDPVEGGCVMVEILTPAVQEIEAWGAVS